LRCRLVLANVQEPASLYEVVVAHDAAVLEQVSQAAAEHALAPAQALLRAAGVHFDTEFASGEPGHTLLDLAERLGCGMVLVGARDSDVLGGALGSVAQTVLQDGGVPVVVVKPPAG
jgi:nucleotide-binding universal stress UspA family protein